MHEAVTLAVAMKEFFGLQPGQKVLDFAAELKKLTPEDKEEIKTLLQAKGVEIKE